MTKQILEPARKRDFFNPRYRFRSAITGQFVPRWFALARPSVTVRERVR
jgi:hypothetical protein